MREGRLNALNWLCLEASRTQFAAVYAALVLAGLAVVAVLAHAFRLW